MGSSCRLLYYRHRERERESVDSGSARPRMIIAQVMLYILGIYLCVLCTKSITCVWRHVSSPEQLNVFRLNLAFGESALKTVERFNVGLYWSTRKPTSRPKICTQHKIRTSLQSIICISNVFRYSDYSTIWSQ